MRYAPDHKAKTRARILRAAGRLFRSRGITATGVDGVMAAAGLTGGGFYAHFPSKEALVEEALESAGEEAFRTWCGPLAHLHGETWARALLATYLSPEHRDSIEKSCILTSLAGDVARGKGGSRQRFEQRLRGMIELMMERTTITREGVVATLALSVGAVSLARAVHDPALADLILTASRERAERLLGLSTEPTRQASGLGPGPQRSKHDGPGPQRSKHDGPDPQRQKQEGQRPSGQASSPSIRQNRRTKSRKRER